VFCPNCGTKNPDSEAKCGQCGFDLQAKAPQARFKGTMVMAPTAAAPKPAAAGTPAPSAQAPATQAPNAAKGGSLKGTMIGVAPPEMARALEEAKAAKAAAQAAAKPAEPPAVIPSAGHPTAANPPAATAKPSLKGTMIGVAPPDMQAAIAAARAKVSGADPGRPGAPEPAPVAGPAPTAKPNIKGTMIGVAPPDMAAAIASHKADLDKRSAEATARSQAVTDPAPAGQVPTVTSSPLGRTPNSKLKGTMMGVAPPDVSQAIAQAKGQGNPAAPSAARSSTAAPSAATPRATEPTAAFEQPATPARAQDLGATMVGTAEPVRESLRPAATANRSPSGQFRGTMVGATSPLVESNDRGDSEPDHDMPNGPDSRAAGNSDHPAAFASTSLSAAAEIAAARANLQRVLADSEPPAAKHPTGRDVPTGAQSPAALRSAAQSSKKNALPILLLGLALVIVAALIAFALMRRSKEAEPPEPAAVVVPPVVLQPAPAQPAPAAPH
jgi:hypothetical protein